MQDEETYRAIETEIGFLKGRDCIYLRNAHFRDNRLLIEGNISGKLATRTSERNILYEILFSSVLAYRCTELDSWSHLYSPDYGHSSSFDQILNSSWLESLNGKVSQDDNHYCFFTYDYVFDIICRSYDLKLFTIIGNSKKYTW